MLGFSLIWITNSFHMSWKYWIMMDYGKTKKSTHRLDKIDSWIRFPKILSLHLFGKSWGNSYIKFPGHLKKVTTSRISSSSGHLKKVTTSFNQTRRRQDFLQKTCDLRRLEDVWFTTSWRRPIYNVLKTSDLHRLEDVLFMTSWRRPIYHVLKRSDLWRLEDV